MFESMRNFGLLLTFFILLSGNLQALGHKQIDNVVVTGDVTDIVLCRQKEKDIWIYRLRIKLRAKNVGTSPVIISSASAMTDFYKIADTIENLETIQYAHIGWVAAGSPGDPKTIPSRPTKPFMVVAPNNSLDIDVDLRAISLTELPAGPYVLQIIAENWPLYSNEYVSKLRQAWSSQGSLWAHSLHSEQIPFVVPANLKKVRCP
jgi:hypothetical protein